MPSSFIVFGQVEAIDLRRISGRRLDPAAVRNPPLSILKVYSIVRDPDKPARGGVCSATFAQ